jgi:hypothetical protein
MAVNDFLPFGTAGGANVLTQAAYQSLVARNTGFASGIASSAQLNKAWRQSSVISAMLAQFIADNSGLDMLDDGSSLASYQTKFTAALTNFSGRRIMLPGEIFHVEVGGSDTTGNGTAAAPWATVNHAYYWLQQHVDCAGGVPTIQCGDGAHAAINIANGITGAQVVYILGNLGTPAACHIDVTGAVAITVWGFTQVRIAGFKVTATGSSSPFLNFGMGILVGGNSFVTYDHMDFGYCESAHLVASGAFLILNVSGPNSVPYTISGGSKNHMLVNGSGMVTDSGGLVTLIGTPNFSDCYALASHGEIGSTGVTYFGTATGTRYRSEYNGMIWTNIGGASHFPGSLAGSAVTGGVYI